LTVAGEFSLVPAWTRTWTKSEPWALVRDHRHTRFCSRPRQPCF